MVHYIWNCSVAFSGPEGEHIYKLNSEPVGLVGRYLPSKALKWREHHCSTILYIKNWDGVTLLYWWPLSIFDSSKQQQVNNEGRRWFEGGVKGRACPWRADDCIPGKCVHSKLHRMPVKHDPTFDSFQPWKYLLRWNKNEVTKEKSIPLSASVHQLIRNVSSTSPWFFYGRPKEEMRMWSLGFAQVKDVCRLLVAGVLFNHAGISPEEVHRLRAALTLWPEHNWWSSNYQQGMEKLLAPR